jgi:hypothetical protein
MLLEFNTANMIGQNEYSILMRFNVSCDPHMSTAKTHREAIQPMAEAMGLNELGLDLGFEVYTDFRNQGSTCRKYHGNGVCNVASPWW